MDSFNFFSRSRPLLLILTLLVLLTGCKDAPLNHVILNLEPYESDSPVALYPMADIDFIQNVPYGELERNQFDLFMPKADDLTPLVIYLHGGGFLGGDKESLYYQPDMINALLLQGVAVATINYSLLSASPIDPDGLGKSLTDAKRALQYLRYNALSFNIDRDRIALIGGSAGAGTALWLGASDDMADYSSIGSGQKPDPVAMQSTRVSAVGAIETQGSYDLVRWETEILTGAFSLEYASAIGFSWYMAAFYGLDELAFNPPGLHAAIRAPDTELAAFRASVDLPALLDSSDAPMYLNNSFVPADLSPILASGDGSAILNALLHYPSHAAVLMNYGLLAQIETYAAIPQMGIDTTGGKSVVQFLVEHLQLP